MCQAREGVPRRYYELVHCSAEIASFKFEQSNELVGIPIRWLG
nr:MAG TPA: hypothetical protein [Caudoviricetes sp.]